MSRVVTTNLGLAPFDRCSALPTTCRARLQDMISPKKIRTTHEQGHKRILAKLLVIVEIFVAKSQPIDPLGNKGNNRMLDLARVSSIREAGGDPLHHPGGCRHLSEEKGSGVCGYKSGVKLGRKVYEVLVDETAGRPLVLPVGTLFQNVQLITAKTYFGRPENAHLITGDGPYAGFSDAELLVAYKTLLDLDRRLDSGEPAQAEAVRVVAELGKFEQLKKGFGPKSPGQRILGTVVEIGIDYFATHPESLGKDSRARQLVTAFIGGLTDTDFAEGSLAEIAGEVLSAAFKTLGDNPQLVADDERLQVLRQR